MFQKKVDNMKMEILKNKNIDIKNIILMSGTLVLPQINKFLFLTNCIKTKRAQSSGKKSEKLGGCTSIMRRKALWRSMVNGIFLLLILLLKAWQLGLWVLHHRPLALSVHGESRTGMVGLLFLFHELKEIKKIRIRNDWM